MLCYKSVCCLFHSIMQSSLLAQGSFSQVEGGGKEGRKVSARVR